MNNKNSITKQMIKQQQQQQQHNKKKKIIKLKLNEELELLNIRAQSKNNTIKRKTHNN